MGLLLYSIFTLAFVFGLVAAFLSGAFFFSFGFTASLDLEEELSFLAADLVVVSFFLIGLTVVAA
ncbi:hypothetical protein, partial [Chryseobacterium sp.]|uniref:hypothetical protein n=1 Tax=Chryseobacterium sp. TaxID=1871047 RepID=UPI002FC66BA9